MAEDCDTPCGFNQGQAKMDPEHNSNEQQIEIAKINHMLNEEPLQTFSGISENFERPISRPSSKKRPTNSSYHNRHRSNASEKSISRTGESLNESS